jgi:polysaccharide pyruvyl transferase WcaK-like protein
MLNLFSIRPKGFNIGNDIIFLGVNHFIRQTFKKDFNLISLPATGKYESQKKSGLNSQTVREINQYGHGVIVGGGNLYENGELEINPVAIKALEKPMMIFSVSRGRIYNNKSELVDRTDVMTDTNIQLINNKSDINLSRDIATHNYVKSLGCNSTLGGCPTLFINEIPQHIVPLFDSNQTDVLISIRTPTLMSIPIQKQYEVREDLLNIIDLLRKKGYSNIKLLCHDHRDIPFAASFNTVEYLYTEDVFTYITFLRNTRLNITYRLHSFIPCLSYDIPTIKISYDERAISMLNTLGLSDWNIDLMKDNVIEEVTNRLDNLDELKVLKNKLQTDWQNIRSTIVNSCELFYSNVLNNMNL